MRPERKAPLPVWFFIGILLILYGFLITGQGMWELFVPPAHPVVLAELRPALWWGALMLVLGAIFVGRTSPW